MSTATEFSSSAPVPSGVHSLSDPTTASTTERARRQSVLSVGEPRRRLDASVCPSGLGGARRVHNAVPAASGSLMPHAQPTAAIVCAYRERHLRPKPRVLDRTHATTLFTALSKVRLYVDPGPVSCPADVGSVDLLVFRLQQGNTFALWYWTSGCQLLDNGVARAGEIANPTF